MVAGVGSAVYNHTVDHCKSTTSLATGKKGLEHMSGKGSRPRPYSVSQAQFGSNWDAIFGKDKNTQPAQTSQKSSTSTTNDATIKSPGNNKGSK
jgi:hypothetical protein